MGDLKEYDLENRLVDFAVRILNATETLPDTVPGRHIQRQLVRSGTSPAPNYGEAQAAESRGDFIHKMKVAVKELKETRIWLKIIVRKGLIDGGKLGGVMAECEELIAIFCSSIETAKRNQAGES